jgi:tetratricopeptide (TPR) repeat protein
MVSQRQLAERQRVEGNALYAQGQFTAALQCYETGLDAERHNMALHGNAAQVLLKMGCHAQAIEHCDKVHRCNTHSTPLHPLGKTCTLLQS